MNEELQNEIELERAAFKPWLKYKIGDIVILKGDEKKRQMVILNYLLSDPTPDYLVCWLNSQAKEERAGYPEKALIKSE